MSIFREPPAQNLSEWLHIATKNLAPMAIPRISKDITSHDEEAVERHIENGLPTSGAEAAALADLGDARAAARRFRRAHMTISEFRTVSLLTRAPRNWKGPSVQAAGYCLFCFLCFVNLHLFRVTNSFAYGEVAVLLLFRIVSILLARRESAVPTPQLLVLMASLNSFYTGLLTSVYPALVFAPYLPAKGEYGFWLSLGGLGLAGLSGIAHGLRLFGLRKKLGNAGEDWMAESTALRNEIPPDKPVATGCPEIVLSTTAKSPGRRWGATHFLAAPKGRNKIAQGRASLRAPPWDDVFARQQAL